MSPDEYSLLCDHILNETMQYISTDSMRRHNIGKSYIKSEDPVYVSAAASSMPITIVYTPVGAGKSALIADRVKGLVENGIPASRIAVLTMNIAKAKQTSLEMPGINCMTFSDFTHAIFSANYHGYELSDQKSIINTLKICENTPFRQALLERMTISDAKDRMCLMTVFVNNHLPETEAELAVIKKTDYALESMICQNRMYQLSENPFCLEEIIINGIHNMPIPTLCCVLEYASIHGCSLFITGMPDETIYEFSMAYGKAMNILSSYMNSIDISVVHLPATKMSPDIQNTLNMTKTAMISTENVQTANITVKYQTDQKEMIKYVLTGGSGYIDGKLANHEQILVLSQSKTDISCIKSVIDENFRTKYPLLFMIDLTDMQPPSPVWGSLLVKHHAGLKTAYPHGINRIELFRQLWLILSCEINNASSKHMKEIYMASLNNLGQLAQSIWIQDDYTAKPVTVQIQRIIDEESKQIQEYNRYIKDNIIMDLSSADIILSTIHSAIDIRCDNTVVYFKNFSDVIDENVYRIALSRANRSEYLIFANSDNFDVPVQLYLKHHLTNPQHGGNKS